MLNRDRFFLQKVYFWVVRKTSEINFEWKDSEHVLFYNRNELWS